MHKPSPDRQLLATRRRLRSRDRLPRPLLTAMTMMRLGLSDASLASLRHDEQRRSLIRASLQLVPFAGIAFLWFIGVVREQARRRRGPALLNGVPGQWPALPRHGVQAAVNANSLLEVLAKPRLATDLWDFGHGSTQVLISVYAMRMAAVFTLSVSTVGMRASAFPRWLALLGYAVALVLLLGAGEHRWVQLAFPLWVLLLSVVILLTRPVARER